MPETAHDLFRYLPVSDRTLRFGLCLIGCGHLRVESHGEHPPREHPQLYRFRWDRGRVLPEYQAIYLAEGEGVFDSSPTGQRRIAAGDVLILFPGVWHRYKPSPGSTWETWWISFNGEFVDRLVANRLLTPDAPVIAVRDRAALLATYRDLIEETLAEPPTNPLRLSVAVMKVLAHVLAPDKPEQPQPASTPFAAVISDRVVAEALRLIWSNPAREMTVSDVVGHFPVTRRSLERRFQRVLGHTILDEITRCRLERAKRLLTETDLPLKAIAIAAGFVTTQRMSKTFQRAVGLAPAKYRAANRIPG